MMKYTSKLFAFVIFYIAFPGVSESAGWRISPIRLAFDQKVRSAIVTIHNENEKSLSLRVKVVEWTQDSNGKDVLTASDDLVFFPKRLTIQPNSERIIRIGVKSPPPANEKTFRLLIKEEVPAQERSTTAVAIAIQFGIPVFISPPVANAAGELASIQVTGGELSFVIKNNGNVHHRIKSVSLSGKDPARAEIFSHSKDGGYLLAGAEKSFNVQLPSEICSQLNDIEIHMDTNRTDLRGKTEVTPPMCNSQ